MLTLEAVLDLDPVAQMKLEEAYAEFQETTVKQLDILRRTSAKVYDEGLGESKQLLVEISRKPKDELTDQDRAFLRSWLDLKRRLVDDSDEWQEASEAMQEVIKRAQLRLIAALPEAKRKKWYEMAGERPELRGRLDKIWTWSSREQKWCYSCRVASEAEADKILRQAPRRKAVTKVVLTPAR